MESSQDQKRGLDQDVTIVDEKQSSQEQVKPQI